ncbi:hypothetical protein ACH5RR_025391, partial [Cinchona calisaya]
MRCDIAICLFHRHSNFGEGKTEFLPLAQTKHEAAEFHGAARAVGGCAVNVRLACRLVDFRERNKFMRSGAEIGCHNLYDFVRLWIKARVNSNEIVWFFLLKRNYTKHGAAEFHGAARAVGGCAVYVSDEIGSHDFEVLKRLVLPDGSILRAKCAGRPTRDCLFVDPVADGKSLLKIWNLNALSGILGVFNCQGAGNWQLREESQNVARKMSGPLQITSQVTPLDIDLLCEVADEDWGGECAVYTFRSGSLCQIRKEGRFDVSLNTLQWEIFTISPVRVFVQDLRFAPIGLIDMYNSGGAVETLEGCISESPGKKIRVRVRGCGCFGAYSSRKPSGCLVDGNHEEFTYTGDNGLLVVQLKGFTLVYTNKPNMKLLSSMVQLEQWVAVQLMLACRLVDFRERNKFMRSGAEIGCHNLYDFVRLWIKARVNSNEIVWFFLLKRNYTKHGAAEFHGAARAVGGCAVYVSDEIGSHDFEVLKRLVLPDGSILRAKCAGRPTRDCLFVDPVADGKSLLKIWNLNALSGILGVFNCQGAGNWQLREESQNVARKMSGPLQITSQVTPLDIDLLCEVADEDWGGECAVYTFRSGSLCQIRKEGRFDVSLNTLQWEIFTISPVRVFVQDLRFAPIGLIDMYNSGGAVETLEGCISESPGKKIRVRVRGCGCFGAYSSRKPSGCLVDGNHEEFTYTGDNGLLVVQLKGFTLVYTNKPNMKLLSSMVQLEQWVAVQL